MSIDGCVLDQKAIEVATAFAAEALINICPIFVPRYAEHVAIERKR